MGMIRLKDLNQNIDKEIMPINNKGIIALNNINVKEIMDEKKTIDFFLRKGIVDNNRLETDNYRSVKNCWRNEPAFIVGGGPALKDFIADVGWIFLDGKHTIGINHVIEDYDRFEWFFFLDKRFLDRTPYHIANYTGKIFAQATTGLKNNESTTVFFCQCKEPSELLEHGLYNGNLSGLAALNLALITGANPIYLLGYGEGRGSSENSYHYKLGYTGEVKTKKVFDKFQNVKKQYEAFSKYADRIIHVTEGSDIPYFKKIKVKAFMQKFKIKSNIVVKQIPNIMHLSFSNKIEDHADITRAVINKCFGGHSLINVNIDNIPNADLYIYEHFISTNIKNIKFPYKHKAIDIVHTVNCLPQGNWKKIIALTDTWKKYLIDRGVINNIQVLKGGINLDEYKGIVPDYNKQVFGRITRWSPGKIHPKWNEIAKEVLDKNPDSKCLIYTQLDNTGSRPLLKHGRMVYDKSVKIDMFKGEYLKNLSVYVHCNGAFKDTMSHAIIEAMATGLPIIYLAEDVIEEMVGCAGIKCNTMEEVKKQIVIMLKDKDKRKEYGLLARNRAMLYHVNNFVLGMDAVIKECLR